MKWRHEHKESDKADVWEFSLLAWPSLLTHVFITTAVAGGASKQRMKILQEKDKAGMNCFLSFTPTYLKKQNYAQKRERNAPSKYF